MKGHRLDSQVDGTAEHNDMLPALLGLLRLLEDLCRRLELSETHRGAPLDQAERTVMLAALGALSLRRTLRDWLGHCATAARPSDSPPDTAIERLWR